MDDILSGFDNLKLSAFSKYSKLTVDIHEVTLGPNSSFAQKSRDETDRIAPIKEEKKKPIPKNTSTNDALPFKQVLREYELQRREKVQEAIDSHYSQFENFMKSQKEGQQNEWIRRQQAFVHSMQEHEQRILQAIDQVDVRKSSQNEQLIKHYQDLIQRKMKYEQQLEKNKEKQRALNENIGKIRRYQTEFRLVYQEIMAVLKTCTSTEQLKNMLGDNFRLMKTLPESFDEIISKCRECKVDEEQVLKTANILNQIKNLKTQIEEANAKITAKKKEQETKQTQPIKKTDAQSAANNSLEIKTTVTSIDQCVSSNNLRKYLEIKQFMSQHTDLFKDLLNNDQLKQFRFDCKKAVNIPVNLISNVSAEHMRDKYTKLSNLLTGRTVFVADKQINASRHPQGIDFCMDLLAKKFVLQGDLLISSNPEAAFWYATVIVSLWNEFPDFGKLLLGYFYTECPYVVPFYIPKTEDQSLEDYYVSLGYHYDIYDDGQIEKHDKFLKRMTGIFRLYFAIFIAKPKRGQSKNPHDIKNAWNFLVSILKLEPQLDITATALHIFLETVGFRMEAVYGVAFKKLVRIIVEKFLPALKEIDSGGPVTRLEGLLQDYKKKGHFDKPNGILSNNFW